MKFIKIVLILLMLSSITNAQELGIAPVKIWTDNYELENPIGFSVYAFQPIWKLGIKIEYSTAFNHRNYYGFITSGLLKETPVSEKVSSKSRCQSWEFGITTPSLNILNDVNIIGAIGVSFDTFYLERTGSATTQTIDFDQDEKHGYFFSLGISYIKPFQMPMKLEVLLKQKLLNSTMFIEDAELPFGNLKSMNTLQFNLSYLF